MQQVEGIAVAETRKPTKAMSERLTQLQAIYSLARQKEEFKKQYERVSRNNLIGKKLDLTKLADKSNNMWAQILRDFEEGLREIDSQNYVLEAAEKGGEYLPGTSISDRGEALKAALKLKAAIESLHTLKDAQGIVNKANLQALLSRFYTSQDNSNAILQKMGDSKISDKDLAQFIRQFIGHIRTDIGYVTEDIMSHILNSKNFGETLENFFGEGVKMMGAQTVDRSAVKGSIRAYAAGLSYTKDGKLMTGNSQGKPLRDVELTYSVSTDGTAEIQLEEERTVGISVKRYSFGNGSADIRMARLSLKNFAKIFQDAGDPKGQDALYLYRIYKGQGNGDANGVGYYLAAQAVEDIYFGQKAEDTTLLQSDRTELMVVNGILMPVSTFMSESTATVKISGLSGASRATYVVPEKVPTFLGELHASKVAIYNTLTFGDLTKGT